MYLPFMKACPCGTVPIVNYSWREGHTIWCPKCKTQHTKAYSEEHDAVIAWVHGIEHLPPWCPFCKIYPQVLGPDSENPRVHCGAALCPLKGLEMSLENWNRCRPIAWTFEGLRDRWKKRPELKNCVRALQKAIRQHQRARYKCDD